jgi:hypothetical protein
MAFNKRGFLQQGNTILVAGAGTAPLGIQAIVGTQEFDRGNQIRVHNAGPNLAFVASGIDAATAQGNATIPGAQSSAAIPVPPGAIEVWTVNRGYFWSAICASGQTASVYLTPGEGL